MLLPSIRHSPPLMCCLFVHHLLSSWLFFLLSSFSQSINLMSLSILHCLFFLFILLLHAISLPSFMLSWFMHSRLSPSLHFSCFLLQVYWSDVFLLFILGSFSSWSCFSKFLLSYSYALTIYSFIAFISTTLSFTTFRLASSSLPLHFLLFLPSHRHSFLYLLLLIRFPFHFYNRSFRHGLLFLLLFHVVVTVSLFLTTFSFSSLFFLLLLLFHSILSV